MIIDTHAHYDNKRFNDDRYPLIESLPAAGIKTVINVGCDLESSHASIRLAEKFPFVYATVGAHPHYVKHLDDNKLDKMKNLCNHKKVVAYGELGLDFFHNFSPQTAQIHWFKRQLELTHELNLPAVIHAREAHDKTAKIIEESKVRKGVVHSFSGNADLAKFYVGLGFHIGIGGVITFDKSGVLEGVVHAIPLEWLLLETDCPYLTPAPYRGKRNDSAKLIYVAEKIAEIKRISTDEVCRVTTANAEQLFGVNR